ncbi:WecB/TagA/CpsF family glycosyltransferase [Acidisphaera sp. S103]|uniref:WecB/TagA/CpsF family glycosyltransferase n=1 Tax=Acidisphaera sp. S103 TaxID=1747223 RepID=UPI00131BE3AE|nr:WecB/TagA/CpsF family glycosyltransferase [Acidisphaera sp. S103]
MDMTDVRPPVRWFLGVPFTPLTLADAAASIAARPPQAPFAFVTTPNAQHIVAAHRLNSLFTTPHDRAWLVLNDSKIAGMLATRLFSDPLAVAAGSDLTAYMFHHHIRSDDTLTIIGASDEVERRLRTQFGMRHIARYDPPMGFYRDPAEIERCVDFILAHPARYIFLAVGAPQSETVACRVLDRGGATGVALCIGSSLHFVTGVVRRAPSIFRKLNAEALYRLMQNPRRHARRVFVESLPVLSIGLCARVASAPDPHRRRPPP